MIRTIAFISVLWLSGASLGCHRAGVALGEALRHPAAPSLSQSGWYPSEIECPYEGWPLYWRERRPNANGQYICLYAGHGHSAVMACD